MNIFDIYVAYVSWGNDGKKRPVLILEHQSNIVTVFNITTRYEDKSEAIRSNYFKINDWAQAGLNKQSYVDTNITVNIPLSSVDIQNPIGKLTDTDVRRLLEFME